MPPAAADVARALNARKCGGGWMAKCPAHDDRTPSLSIGQNGDGMALFHCHAGCSQDAVLAALKQAGLWHDGPAAATSQVWRRLTKAKPMTSEITDDEKESQAACQRAWDAAVPAENTAAQIYLQCRGIVSTETPLPPSLRFLEAKNALVGAITRPDSDELVGLHVVFLEEDAAGVTKKKKLSYGPIRFGSIKLSSPDTTMQITESLEDGLALAQMNGAATLAVPGTAFYAHVVPPEICRTVVLAPDNDEAGRKAIEVASPRLHALGLTVRVLLPPPEMDWCDIIYEIEERTAIREEATYG
jgi:putative DNA primase/helicase